MSNTVFNAPFAEHKEEGIAINGTATFDLPADITMRPHLFINVWFENSGAEATPSAGTITSVSLAPVGNSDQYEAVANSSTVDATAAIPQMDAAGNYVSCRIITDSLADVDEIIVKITANES